MPKRQAVKKLPPDQEKLRREIEDSMRPGDSVADAHHSAKPFHKWRSKGWELAEALAVRVDHAADIVKDALIHEGIDHVYTNKMVVIVSTYRNDEGVHAKGVYSYDDRTFGIVRYVNRTFIEGQ